MRKDRLTPRNDRKRQNKSISPYKAPGKAKLKNVDKNIDKNIDKENEPLNSKDENSMKICLDLANYHKKESQMLKRKNDLLQEKYNDQVEDLQDMREQMKKIKSSLSNNQSIKRENQQLKDDFARLAQQNQGLKDENKKLQRRIAELSEQNCSIKNQIKQAESVYVESGSKCDNFDIRPLSFAKESRRQELVNKYEGINFTPSVTCLGCKNKESSLEQAKNQYSQDLTYLQGQLASLQDNQMAIQQLQRELASKTECIDYLLVELGRCEADSSGIMKTIDQLQTKISDISAQNMKLKSQIQPFSPYSHSISRSMA